MCDKVLEYNEWVKWAEEKGLFLSIDDMQALPMDTPMAFLKPEYFRFLLIAYGSHWPHVSRGVAYDPIPFFEPFQWVMKRVGDVRQELTNYFEIEADGTQVRKEEMKPWINFRWVVIEGEPSDHVMAVMSCRKDRLAHSGSGDGWGRFILFDRLRAEVAKPGGVPQIRLS